jgi:hypothetical protein
MLVRKRRVGHPPLILLDYLRPRPYPRSIAALISIIHKLPPYVRNLHPVNWGYYTGRSLVEKGTIQVRGKVGLFVSCMNIYRSSPSSQIIPPNFTSRLPNTLTRFVVLPFGAPTGTRRCKSELDKLILPKFFSDFLGCAKFPHP